MIYIIILMIQKLMIQIKWNQIKINFDRDQKNLIKYFISLFMVTR